VNLVNIKLEKIKRSVVLFVVPCVCVHDVS